MRFGICASLRQAAGLVPVFDYLEESVQGFLIPEKPQQEFEALLQTARQLPVPIEAANLFIPGDLLLIETPQQTVDHARLRRYVRTALQRAEQAGIRVIVFGSGKARACPEGYSQLDVLHQLGEHLRTWDEWARQHGVEIAIEPLNYAEANTINTVVDGGKLATQLSDGGVTNVRLLADTYHMARNGEDPETIVSYGSLLSHVHVAELQGRAAPGTHGEDFRPYFRALRKAGYDRRISIESSWQDQPAQLPVALATLRAQWESSAQ
jgi:sugar phosphate isomerase/epimerase